MTLLKKKPHFLPCLFTTFVKITNFYNLIYDRLIKKNYAKYAANDEILVRLINRRRFDNDREKKKKKKEKQKEEDEEEEEQQQQNEHDRVSEESPLF